MIPVAVETKKDPKRRMEDQRVCLQIFADFLLFYTVFIEAMLHE